MLAQDKVADQRSSINYALGTTLSPTLLSPRRTSIPSRHAFWCQKHFANVPAGARVRKELYGDMADDCLGKQKEVSLGNRISSLRRLDFFSTPHAFPVGIQPVMRLFRIHYRITVTVANKNDFERVKK